MPATAVVFDIGNVLIEWQPERFYDRRIGSDRRREMFAALDLHGMNDRVDRGEDFRQTVEAFARANPDRVAEITLWHDAWSQMAGPAIPHSVRLLRALRGRGVPVFALSNFGIAPFATAETHYDFLSEFDRRYISGHMGVIKPEPEIYARVEADCGLVPEALLFIDDRLDNIAAAEARGWRTHHFTGPEGLARRLVSDGLLSAGEAG